MIKAVVFDWGGTITYDGVFGIFGRSLAKKTGVPYKEILRAFEINNEKYLTGKISGKKFWTEFGKEVGIKRTPSFFIARFLEAGKADPESLDIVKGIKKHYKTAILSDNYKELADQISNMHGELFDILVFSNNVSVKKPNPAIYKILLKRLGLKPGECVFIDDRKENIEGANSVGMKGILFMGNKRLKKDLVKMGIRGL